MKSLVILLLFVGVCAAAPLLNVVSLREKGAFKTLFEKVPYQDVSQAYYAVKGMKSLGRGAELPTAVSQAACNSVKSAKLDDFDNLFYAAEILNEVRSCKQKLPQSSVGMASKKLSDDSDALTLYRSVCILSATGTKIDADAVMKNLENSVENVGNSVIASSYALLAALRLTGVKDFAGLLKQADVEDMAAQSDEVDGQYAHFENDLATTATFVTAAFEASSKIKSVKPMDNDQAILFLNFILRHKSDISHEKVFYILTSLTAALTSDSKFIKAQVLSGNSISKDNPDIKLSITNVLSTPVESVTVKVESVTRSSDNEAIMSNLPLKKDSKTGFYSIKMWDAKPKSGFYDVSINIAAPSGSIAGVDELEFKVKVTTVVKVINVKVASLERDATISSSKMAEVDFLKKAPQMTGDTQQKIVMTFKVQDTMDNSFFKPHQVFVRFVHKTSNEEVIFIAEADTTSTYKFEVDLNTASKDQFQSKSGLYSMELIIGDAAINNPIQWEVADVKMKFDDSGIKQKAPCMYEKKKEIKHLFREKEPRPPAVVSTAFTAACLAPILILFVSWARVGANVSNLSLAPANLLFHLGLGGIFFIYYLFWIKINMFTTVQYLLGIGLLTFVAGNKVLSKIAAQRE